VGQRLAVLAEATVDEQRALGGRGHVELVVDLGLDRGRQAEEGADQGLVLRELGHHDLRLPEQVDGADGQQVWVAGSGAHEGHPPGRPGAGAGCRLGHSCLLA
jgi:hypothetical protein